MFNAINASITSRTKMPARVSLAGFRLVFKHADVAVVASGVHCDEGAFTLLQGSDEEVACKQRGGADASEPA